MVFSTNHADHFHVFGWQVITAAIHKSMVYQAYRVTRNVEDAEDATQIALLKYLDNPKKIEYPKTYFTQAAHLAAHNVNRTKNTTIIRGSSPDGIENLESFFQFRDIFFFNRFFDEINALPYEQRHVMLHVLNGGKFAELKGNYNTHKANWRHASLKLIEALKDIR